MTKKMDKTSHETESSEDNLPPPHAASTMPPSSEEVLTDAELSARRGLSHRDGPRVAPVRVTERMRAELIAKAQGGKAP